MKYNNATYAFEAIYKKIITEGEDYAGTKAIFNESFSLLYPEDKIITTPERKFNLDYANFEWDWYLKGDRDAKEIGDRAKIWKQMMVPGTTNVVSNYGYFWNYNDQLKRVINELKTNPETRKAIIVHYLLHELEMYKYDTPCNVALNFYIRNEQLHLTIFARSIDLWFGFGNDQYCFAKLMEKVSSELKIPVGEMGWMITNLHIYPRHYNLLEK